MKAKVDATGYRLVFGCLGLFMMLIGILLLVPLVMMFPYNEYDAWPFFVIPAAFSLLVGFLLHFFLLRGTKQMKFVRHQDSLLVFLIWVYAIFAGAAPMYIATRMGKPLDMGLMESIFEATSSYSTTGLSVWKGFVDVEGAYCPHVYCFHRSFMQWVGGLGFILLITSIIGKSGSFSLFKTEGHTDRITASMGKTAKLIFGIYTLYTVLGILALFLSGLPWFDAINTTMSAISGGGLSVRSSNIFYYRPLDGTMMNGVLPVNAVGVEVSVIVLSILSAISFVLHTFLFTGRVKDFLKDAEIRFSSFVLLFFTVFAFICACFLLDNFQGNPWQDAGTTFRDVVFYTVMSMTNSGFANTSLSRFFALGKPLFWSCMVLMFMGGGLGSTAGGVKGYRWVTIIKDLGHSLKMRFAPANLTNPCTSYRYGQKNNLTENEKKEAHNYLFLFLALFIFSVFLISAIPTWYTEGAPNNDISSIAFNVISAMSNTGLAANDLLDIRSFAFSSGLTWSYYYYLIVLTIDMLLGRLEIMPFIYSISNIREEIKYNFERGRKAARLASDSDSIE